MIISKAATVFEFTLSPKTLHDRHVARVEEDPGHIPPEHLPAAHCRVVFPATAGFCQMPEAFAEGPDAAGALAWMPIRGWGAITAEWVVSVAARGASLRLLGGGDRGGQCSVQELPNGALLVRLGTL